MLNKKKESESWEITLWEYLVFYLNLDGRKKRTKKRYYMLSRFIRTLLSTQKKEMIEEVEKMKVDLREKNEMLPNVYHRCKGYNQAISNILQKMKEE